MATIVQNVHSVRSLTIIHKSVFMSVDKILSMTLLKRNVFAYQDMESLIKFAQNAQPTTLFKVTTALHVHSTQF